MRYRLRTLLILLAILPPLLWLGWTEYSAWRAEQDFQKRQQEIQQQAASAQRLREILQPLLEANARESAAREQAFEAEIAEVMAEFELDSNERKRVEELQRAGFLPANR